MLRFCLHACWYQQVVIPVSLKHNLVLHDRSTLVLPQGEKKKTKTLRSPMAQTLNACEQRRLFSTAISVAARVDIKILAVGNNNHLKTVQELRMQ